MVMNGEVHERWSRMLQEPDSEVQTRALTEIGRAFFRPTEPLEDVMLGGAIHTVGHARAELPLSLRDAILEKLNADDPTMRAEAVLALVHWRDEKTIHSLLERLSDPDSTVRLAAVQTLAIWGEARFIPDLLEVAQSDSEELVRAHALSALEQIPKEAIRSWEGRAAGAIRTRGGTTMPTPVAVLNQIARSDNSRYVAFLAEKVCRRFKD